MEANSGLQRAAQAPAFVTSSAILRLALVPSSSMPSCEGELFESDLTAASTSSHLLERQAGTADSYSLYEWINSNQSTALNIREGSISRVLRPHDKRNTTLEEESIGNLDEDDGLIFEICFTELGGCPAPLQRNTDRSLQVRIKQLLISIPPLSDEERPAYCRVWVNRLNLGFEDVHDVEPDQEFTFVDEPGCVEYGAKMSRFASVSNVTLYFVGLPRSSVLADSLRSPFGLAMTNCACKPSFSFVAAA
jgi:hypothetical protein